MKKTILSALILVTLFSCKKDQQLNPNDKKESKIFKTEVFSMIYLNNVTNSKGFKVSTLTLIKNNTVLNKIDSIQISGGTFNSTIYSSNASNIEMPAYLIHSTIEAGGAEVEVKMISYYKGNTKGNTEYVKIKQGMNIFDSKDLRYSNKGQPGIYFIENKLDSTFN